LCIFLSNNIYTYPDHQHITVGDFNLHHLLWAGIHAPAAYTAADRLIEVMIEESTAQLLTPLRLITFPTTWEGIIINLAFVTEEILNKLLECKIALKLDFSSDY
jgi:hypothetical protein